MINLRKEYKQALKKHGSKGVLNMYRDNKIELNENEWQNLKDHFKKESLIKIKNDRQFGRAFAICLVILILAGKLLDTSNFEKIKQCNRIQGHTCTKYEIEKMEVKK